MYSPHGTYNSPPPELSNNPFIDHPSNALARFPDISGSDSSSSNSQFTSWVPPSATGNAGAATGYGASGPQAIGMSPQNSSSFYSQTPQQPTWGVQQGIPNTYGGSGYASPPIQSQPTGLPFQPTSSFGQQLAGQMNGGYGGVPQQQPPQYTGYPTQSQYSQGMQQGYGAQPQPPQQQNQYLAEFDPYASRSGGGQAPGQVQGPQGTIPAGASQYNTPHPREYIRDHKSEMEQWDQYTWKQTMNAFDALKEAWAARKRELETRAKAFGGAGLFGGGNYGGYGGQAQQLAQLEQMAREADLNCDSVAASTFQMQEVFGGYRQSGDLASKRRVRESINAALANLPDWPSRLY
ncbi:hypothetical protein QCA50_005807 [Cerrena zonata]|uniref:Uncharacterized protein n=1 Tax=Cerrena zonata TaxID=2478898 RepID=A0AAW0GKD3_9APHY